jgi:hypothetical protein
VQCCCAERLRPATTPSDYAYLLRGAVWLTTVSGCLFSCVAGQGNRIAEPRTSITSRWWWPRPVTLHHHHCLEANRQTGR